MIYYREWGTVWSVTMSGSLTMFLVLPGSSLTNRFCATASFGRVPSLANTTWHSRRQRIRRQRRCRRPSFQGISNAHSSFLLHSLVVAMPRTSRRTSIASPRSASSSGKSLKSSFQEQSRSNESSQCRSSKSSQSRSSKSSQSRSNESSLRFLTDQFLEMVCIQHMYIGKAWQCFIIEPGCSLNWVASIVSGAVF